MKRAKKLNDLSYENDGLGKPSAHSSVAPIQDVDTEIDLRDLFRLIWKYKWSIILITFCAMAASYVFAINARPIYTATSEVLLQETQQPVDLGALVIPGGGVDKEVATEIEVIRSRDILTTVVERLDLVNNSEYNKHLGENDLNFLEKMGYWPIEIVSVFPPNVLFGEQVEPKEPPTQRYILRKATDILEGKTSVVSLRDTTIILVTVESWSAMRAAEIANVIGDEYLKARVQVRIDAQKFASKFIGDRVVEMREEVELAEAEAQNYRSENAILEEDSSEVIRFEAMQNRVYSVISREERLIERLRLFDNSVASGARLSEAARLLDDRRINAMLLSGYNASVEDRILETVSRLRADIALVAERRIALQNSLNTLESSLKDEGNKLVRYRQLVREAEASRLLFETFLSRQKETAAQQGLIKPDARILTFAEAPYSPSRPRKSLIFIIGTLVGLMLGIGFALVRSIAQNTFTSMEELENATKITVFGAVPNIGNLSKRSNIFNYLIKKPNSQIAEALRSLRTSILLSNVDNPPKVIVVTSSVPAEGKSIATILLGLVTAQMGLRALVIDADLRRNTLHRTLKVSNDVGIISVLSGSVSFEDAVHKNVQPNLDVMVVENNTINATDMISSKAFRNMIAQAREEYDMVFLDAPPILAVTDVRIFAQHTDSLVYIVKWNDTPRDLVQRGIKIINSSGIKISGLVFGRYDSQGDGYQYGYYKKSIKRYYRS